MKQTLWLTNNQRFISFFLITVLLWCGITSCDNREEGKKLAEAGISASEKLAEYYDSLTEDAVDTAEFYLIMTH